jgi:hypothetical protein
MPGKREAASLTAAAKSRSTELVRLPAMPHQNDKRAALQYDNA